jgi:aspartyl protease family protein
MRGRAATIQLRSLQAKNVPIVVQTYDKATYGENVDGLLGMSFLSRFQVTIDTQAVKISNRKVN